MKIIDLLNKIANGEEVPKKLNYMGETYLKTQYDDTQNFMIDYLSEEGENAFFDIYNISAIINDEVEIIEEDKKIEPIEWNIDDDNCQIYFNGAMNYVSRAELELALKINEIIDYLKSKGE